MKVVCVRNKKYYYNNSNNPNIGEIYEIKHLGQTYALIDTKDGFTAWYPKDWFITLEEYRSDQIDKIINHEPKASRRINKGNLYS